MKESIKFFLVLILIVMAGSLVIAGDKENKLTNSSSGSVKGVILDKLTGEKLAGVCLRIDGTNEKVYTDADGAFTIPVSAAAESQTIEVKCLSYEDKMITIDEKDLKKKKLVVELKPVLP